MLLSIDFRKNNNGLSGISDTLIVQPRGEIWSCALGGFFPAPAATLARAFYGRKES